MTTPTTAPGAPPPMMLSEQDERALIAQTEQKILVTYPHGSHQSQQEHIKTIYVRNPANQNRVLLDARQHPVTVDRILATNPLRQDLSSRAGPGGRRLTYISGEAISRSLNEVFGYEGWNLDIKSATQTSKQQDKQGRWVVAYVAHVRVTLVQSGTYKEDMGHGESTDKNLQAALGNALKTSITDALKRAARHFGNKLGNACYESGFVINKAPKNLFDALNEMEKTAQEKWGASNVPSYPPCGDAVENQQAPENNPSRTNTAPSTTAALAAAASTTTATTHMPPPHNVAPINHHNAPSTHMVTPNVANKPINVYQRNSLGSQIASTSATLRTSLDASTSTTTTTTASVYATPRATNNNNNNSITMAVRPPPAAAHYNTRPFSGENSSAAANPANNFYHHHHHHHDAQQQQQQQQQQETMQRPCSSWGKRPTETVPSTTTAEPPKQRPRHNPYA